MTRVSSIFSQLLQLFSRLEFQSAVQAHKAERHARGFTCWGQFVAMLFCQLGRAQSLREICGGLAASEGKLKHLGLPRGPSRSTLAYANAHRPWQLYESVFHQLLEKCRGVAASQPGKKKRKFRFKNRLLSLDASVISLCASVQSSQLRSGRFRRKQGLLAEPPLRPQRTKAGRTRERDGLIGAAVLSDRLACQFLRVAGSTIIA